MAAAILLAPVMVQVAYSEAVDMFGEGVDILGDGIFETDGNAFTFPVGSADTNYDSVQVGDDKATAFGTKSGFPFGLDNGPGIAQNNLEIKKNQNSSISGTHVKINIEQIKVGDREALAIGSASAINDVKIVTNQV